MNRIYIFCEGQTEETFVREVLAPHFERLEIWLYPILISTGKQGKGGISTYGKIKREIEIKCKEDPSAWVTSMFDFYGLPKDFPETATAKQLSSPKPSSIEQAKIAISVFQKDIAQRNFIANLTVHEFEGLLFSSPEAFENWFDISVVERIRGVRNKFKSPEHINNGIETAPSKRILAVCEKYDKILHGSYIALDIGLESIRQECSLFDQWLKKLENIATELRL